MDHAPRHAFDLRELRRVVTVVADPVVRIRLLDQLAMLDGVVSADIVAEIAAATELRVVRAELRRQTERADAAERSRSELVVAAGDARRAAAAADAQLRELRELAGEKLADQLLEAATRLELSQPTSPPQLALRRAADLARAVGATRPTW